MAIDDVPPNGMPCVVVDLAAPADGPAVGAAEIAGLASVAAGAFVAPDAGSSLRNRLLPSTTATPTAIPSTARTSQPA